MPSCGSSGALLGQRDPSARRQCVASNALAAASTLHPGARVKPDLVDSSRPLRSERADVPLMAERRRRVRGDLGRGTGRRQPGGAGSPLITWKFQAGNLRHPSNFTRYTNDPDYLTAKERAEAADNLTAWSARLG